MQGFWKDERGTIELSSWFVLVVMIALGLIVGLSNIRMELTQQFGDVSQALESVDQSYSYTVNNVTSMYSDTYDLPAQAAGTPPAGIDLAIACSPES
jgi:Flp pilus assembly pilin Flp